MNQQPHFDSLLGSTRLPALDAFLPRNSSSPHAASRDEKDDRSQ